MFFFIDESNYRTTFVIKFKWLQILQLKFNINKNCN